MAFCKNCGTQLSDKAAFCPKCGTPAASKKQPTADGQPSPAVSPAGVPDASKTRSVSGTRSAPAAAQRVLDQKKITREILLNALYGFLCCSVIPLVALLLIGKLAGSPGSMFAAGLLSALLGALLSAGFCALTIKRRLGDPRDDRYEVGSHQLPVLNEMFLYKYGRFKDLIEEGIVVLSTLLFIGLFGFFATRFGGMAPSQTPDAPFVPEIPERTYASEALDPSSDANTDMPDLSISSTTYFVEESDFASTLILEPDGSCAYLAEYATDSVYYYGTYETVRGSVLLYLETDDGSIYTIPLAGTDGSLRYTGADPQLTFFPDAVYRRSETVPESVQYYPPHSEPTAVSQTVYYACEEPPELPDENHQALILNPDNSCAFIGNFSSHMGYRYGWYEITGSGVILHLDMGDGRTDDVVMSDAANGLDYNSSSNDENSYLYSWQGRFFQCDEMPVSVACINLNEFLASLPNEMQPTIDLTDLDMGIPPASELYPGDFFSTYVYYLDTISTDDGTDYHLFYSEYFDPMNGDYIGVNAQSGELLGLRIQDDTLYEIPLDSWLRGYFVTGVDPWQ